MINLILLILIPTSWGFQKITDYKNQTRPNIIIEGISISFPLSYKQSRETFGDLSTQIKKINPNADYGRLLIPSDSSEDLSIGYTYIPHNTRRLVIISSGTHGAEAMAGQAVQELLLKKIIADQLPPHDYLFIHTVNPFGARYFRRTNENNVDLNRNYGDNSLYQTINSYYEKYKFIFHPNNPVNQSFWSKYKFFMKLIWIYLTQGKEGLLKGLEGQYHDPQGTNYGGTTLNLESIETQNLIKKYAKTHSHILHIDIHTGYGAKGVLHLLGVNSQKEKQQQLRQQLFKGYPFDSGEDKDFYQTYGGFTEWTSKAFSHKTSLGVVFEFGTSDSQTIRGGLNSLWAFVTGNQGFNHEYKSSIDQKTTNNIYENLFNPQDKRWQIDVLNQANDTITAVLNRFTKKVQKTQKASR